MENANLRRNPYALKNFLSNSNTYSSSNMIVDAAWNSSLLDMNDIFSIVFFSDQFIEDGDQSNHSESDKFAIQ